MIQIVLKYYESKGSSWDKAKIGEEVKSVAGVWKTHQKINEDDDEETIKQKEFYNSLLSDRKPYFFKHLYKKEKDRYNAYKSRANDRCYREYRITLKELLAMPKDELTNDQNEFIKNFNDNNGFINSNCEMNRLCKYIESIDFDVSQKIRNEENFNPLDLMIDGIEWNESVYKKVRGYTDLVWKDYIDITKKTAINTKKVTELDETLTKKNEWFGQQLKEDLLTKICSNEDELTNYLIKYFFIDRKTVSKSIFWKFFGDSVYKNLLRRNNYIIQFPLSEENNGDIEFLRDVFTIYNVDLREESAE